MMRFDYERAWTEVVTPMFKTLPANCVDLYVRVCQECEGLSQRPHNLYMPWPKLSGDYDETLKVMFDKIPAEVLSKAARVIYFYGHLSPDGHSYVGTGGTWKFANYATQSLVERLKIRRGAAGGAGQHHNGMGCYVHDGAVRAYAQTSGMWTWREVGYATQALVDKTERLQISKCSAAGIKTDVRGGRDKWEAAAYNIIEDLPERLLPSRDTLDGRFFRMAELFQTEDS